MLPDQTDLFADAHKASAPTLHDYLSPNLADGSWQMPMTSACMGERRTWGCMGEGIKFLRHQWLQNFGTHRTSTVGLDHRRRISGITGTLTFDFHAAAHVFVCHIASRNRAAYSIVCVASRRRLQLRHHNGTTLTLC